jgi:hypothetical protein
MQWLTLVSEDAGVQRLKSDARQPATARAVDAVAAYPAAHPAQLGEGASARKAPVKDRRQGERRKQGDRRKEQQPVLLDTRSRHDRRSIDNRRQSQTSGAKHAPSPARRINLYA